MAEVSAVFLQCRLGSLRFPSKALKYIEDLPIIQIAMRALKGIQTDYHVLLTDAESVSALRPLARQEGFILFCGSSQDVLHRFVRAAEDFAVDRIIRATGDNPCVSSYLANLLQNHPSAKEADYAGFIGPPLGVGVELVKTKALIRAATDTEHSYDREHVCPYLYYNPHLFSIARIQAHSKYCASFSVSVDIETDFENLKKIYALRSKERYQKPLEIDELLLLVRSQFLHEHA